MAFRRKRKMSRRRGRGGKARSMAKKVVRALRIGYRI